MREIGSRTVTERAREIPVIADTDVLVIGSGPGGLAAALAAARAGVEVMLVERFGCLGGNITVVGVESIAWYRRPGTIDCEGIGIELESRAKDMGATNPEPQSGSEAINADMFKYVADKLVEEAGVRPLLHAVAIDTIVEDGALAGVIVHSKSGRGAILARRVVDASGDADLAHFAGAPYHKTPKEKMLPVTVMFSVAGVDRRRFRMRWMHDRRSNFRLRAGSGMAEPVLRPCRSPTHSPSLRPERRFRHSGQRCPKIRRRPSANACPALTFPPPRLPVIRSVRQQVVGGSF